ncbi:CoA transferase [Gordonia sp. GONU]|uniref:CoA transferase n=1 Tax=Gordonia sp. GONU TaxID=2972949 RepID=UPI0021ABD2D0|nr:CoA transferase [Gordonia sp. GONU]MCR8899862.1 CoA transferase [Gordonia sp. GONU]
MASSAEEEQIRRPVFGGVRVLDLTQGIAGAITTMLLADAGAEVVRVDIPGDRFADLSGYRVWHRGKSRLALDPTDPGVLEQISRLIGSVDVVVETVCEDGTLTELAKLLAASASANPSLIRCSITGYGDAAAHEGRTAVDALVAARTGLYWEARGIPGTTIGALSGWDDPLAGIDLGPGTGVGPDRPGPMFMGIPWVSNATAYLATIGVSAALRSRNLTGAGQHVETSLLQGALCAGSIAWQRVSHPDSEGYLGWTTDPRAPKGFYRSADGRWIQQWVQLPAFMLGVSEGDEMRVPESGVSPKDADLRISTDYLDMVMLGHFHPEMAAAAAKFPADQWEAAAKQAGVPFEIVRSPEEALLDDALVADGCVREFDDPDVGPIRAVGDVIHLSRCASGIDTRLSAGDRTSADVHVAPSASGGGSPGKRRPGDGPLAGVRVLDLGLAIAGPFGAQMLASLGADVIRVSAANDATWMRTQYSHMSNRGKRSVVLDLKSPEGKAIFDRLVEGADVVHHNMRESAARRLGVDEENLRAINPKLIYCHTRGYERGARDGKPANDQTAAALAGTEWVDGAADNGGTPIWPSVSLGDTGNGLLSAIGVLWALYHRDLTGEGQSVDTSIVYAHMLNASMAWTTPDGSRRGDRPVIDAESWGISALERIYPTADGYVCLAVTTEQGRAALAAAIPEIGDLSDDSAIADRLGTILAGEPSAIWTDRFDRHGVPAEALPGEPATVLFDDPDLKERGLIASYTDPELGSVEMAGRLIDIDGARVLGRAPRHGEHTREVLAELGFEPEHIEHLVADGIVVAPSVQPESEVGAGV